MPNPENVIGNGRQWQPGQSGNIKGRPKRLPDLDELLAKVLLEKRNDKTAVERIVRALSKKAMRGNIAAAMLLLDRAYGKVRQNFDCTSTQKSEQQITAVRIVKTVRHQFPDDTYKDVLQSDMSFTK